jgi:hypothetical protein
VNSHLFQDMQATKEVNQHMNRLAWSPPSWDTISIINELSPYMNNSDQGQTPHNKEAWGESYFVDKDQEGNVI